jgi:hypothetical protein
MVREFGFGEASLGALIDGYLNTVHGDVTIARDRAARESTQFNRRAYVRALFASIEAHLSAIKQGLLRASPESPNLTTAERAVLGERTFHLDDDGFPDGGAPLRSDFKRRLLFLVRLRARQLGIELVEAEFGRKSEGWADFSAAVKVRHRLTHPDSTASAEVSDHDLDVVERGHAWFDRCNRTYLRPPPTDLNKYGLRRTP